MRVARRFQRILQLVVLALVVIAMAGAPATAAVTNPSPSAKVSFTFDDGLASNLTQAAPALAAHGLSGTAYITTGCVGMATTPNSCAADTDEQYLTWDQVAQLQNTYGWEIGGHTVTHPQLSTDGLTDQQLAQEVGGGRQALVDHGFNPAAFATPYGDYDNRVLAEIAKHYSSHRGFWDVDNNVWPHNDYLLNNMQVQTGVTVAQVKTRIDQAIASNQWLILTFHDIKTSPSTDPEEYEYATASLSEIAAYVKTKRDAGQIKTPTISQGLVTSTGNLLTNGGFTNGISGGWTTDTPAAVVADNGNHGSYPDPTSAVSFVAGATNSHLFSPKVSVTNTETYMIKSFLNMTARTSGELGYYIDEYDAGNNWISGQWIGAKTSPTVEAINFTYTPTSTAVKKARLQVYANANSGIRAYVDSFQWFSLQDTTPAPPTNNLLPNSTFDHGIADGWTTDNGTVFSADAANHGSPSDTAHAIKLTGSTAAAHLFAPKVTVKNTSTYNINAYLNLSTLASGEVAFYIDEYSSNTWVSGQYAYAQRNAGNTPVGFTYIPTSAAVTKARLQIIVTGNSGVNGYLDSVTFLAPAGEPPTPPLPAGTNLITNGTFDSGMSGGWTTNDPTNITADTGNHGSPNNPNNAISLISSGQNRHLFSPQVVVDPTRTYTISAFLNLFQISSGEVGFYVDEYDLNGNWISGQYKTGVNVTSTGDASFQYTPSSANVSKAALQVIVTGNSGIRAYLDDIRWFQNQ
jgi:peptidoglycan/xylan/chitin deacetylase (PgdA/CDA1 family)